MRRIGLVARGRRPAVRTRLRKTARGGRRRSHARARRVLARLASCGGAAAGRPCGGREAQVKRINRRKRRAVLELQILGRTVEVPVGLEILRKQR